MPSKQDYFFPTVVQKNSNQNFYVKKQLVKFNNKRAKLINVRTKGPGLGSKSPLIATTNSLKNKNDNNLMNLDLKRDSIYFEPSVSSSTSTKRLPTVHTADLDSELSLLLP